MTGVPVPDRQERVADALRARDELARETVEEARAFPTYEVPELVRVRYPTFDPADPETWPEPDRCTDGRPWGHEAYSFGTASPGEWARRWGIYLQGRARPCRNRWKDPETRLCGTHVKPYRESVQRAQARLRRNARIEEHLDLARRLHELHGIEADGSTSTGVILSAGAARELLDLLNLGLGGL